MGAVGASADIPALTLSANCGVHVQQKPLLDDLVGAGEQSVGHGEAERLGGL